MITLPGLPEKFVFSAAVSKAATVEPSERIQKNIVWQGESITNQLIILSYFHWIVDCSVFLSQGRDPSLL